MDGTWGRYAKWKILYVKYKKKILKKREEEGKNKLIEKETRFVGY